jgi:hypothetical protein
MCYQIQEAISLLDVGVEEGWKIYADHPPAIVSVVGPAEQDQ